MVELVETKNGAKRDLKSLDWRTRLQMNDNVSPYLLFMGVSQVWKRNQWCHLFFFYSTHFSFMSRSGTCFTHNATEIPSVVKAWGRCRGRLAWHHLTFGSFCAAFLWHSAVVLLETCKQTRGRTSLTLRTNCTDYDSPRSAAGEV